MAECRAYERRDKRMKQITISPLEHKIQHVRLCITDKICVYNTRRTYGNYDIDWFYPDVIKYFDDDTLLVACKDRTYLKIALNVLSVLQGSEIKSHDFYALKCEYRAILYNKITKDPNYNRIKKQNI